MTSPETSQPARTLGASRVFSLVVVITLVLYGLIGVVLLHPAVIGGLHGHDAGGHISQHFRLPEHRVHDLTFSLLIGTAFGGMLAQLWRPSEHPAAQLMALIPWLGLALAFVLAGTRLPFAPAPILGVLSLLAVILHPTARGVFRSFRVSRVNPVTLALVLISAVPLLVLASINIGLQRTTNEHAALGHYGFMAAFGFTVIGVGLLASLQADGSRLTPWVAGLLPALLGLISMVFPDNDSSLGLISALAAVGWGIVFIAAAERARARGARPG